MPDAEPTLSYETLMSAFRSLEESGRSANEIIMSPTFHDQLRESVSDRTYATTLTVNEFMGIPVTVSQELLDDNYIYLKADGWTKLRMKEEEEPPPHYVGKELDISYFFEG